MSLAVLGPALEVFREVRWPFQDLAAHLVPYC